MGLGAGGYVLGHGCGPCLGSCWGPVPAIFRGVLSNSFLALMLNIKHTTPLQPEEKGTLSLSVYQV